ncbi:O-methyltransferase-domain-containing protein [Aspergillus terricola var. indicus]
MSMLSPLETLAETISATAKIISGYCTLDGIPHPSSGPDSPSVALPHTAPEYVREARQQLLSAAKEVLQIAAEPSEYLPMLAIQYQYIACIKWLAHSQVFAAVPLTGAVPYSQLASICAVPMRQLQSVTRMAITSGCLCEPELGKVAHNGVSRQFVTTPAYLGWVRFITDFYMPVSAQMAEATEKWGESEQPTETAVNLAMKTPMSAFAFITRSREFNRLFAAYMKGVSASEGTAVRNLLTDYDWARLEQGLLVHIDGGPGTVCVALAEAFPSLRFVVQDSAEQINQSRSFLKSQLESVRSAIELGIHNHCDEQPIQHADVYLLRMVLHNHTDANAIRILAPLVRPLRTNPAARLLIADTVLPEPGDVGCLDEALQRYRDLTMQQVFNTRERSLAEFQRLLDAVSDSAGQLVVENIRRSPGSALSVIEVSYHAYTNGHKVDS